MPSLRYVFDLMRRVPWVKEIFPGRSCGLSAFLRILVYIFTRHGGKVDVLIYIVQIVGMALLLMRFEFYEAASPKLQMLIYGSIWLIVLTVSVICCYIYCKMIHYTWKKRQLLIEQSNKYGRRFVVTVVAPMLCFGFVSSYTLLMLAVKVHDRVEEMEFSFIWMVLFYLTAFFRVSERILATVFVAFVVPITRNWADQLQGDQEEILLELFPWKVFLFFHRIILLTTFFGKPWYLFELFEDGLHIISLLFRIVAMVWLFVLVLYVGYRPAVSPSQQETQYQTTTSTQEVKKKQEMVVQSTLKVNYPPNSALVTGVTQKYFPLKRRPPDSNPVGSSSDALVAHNCYKHSLIEVTKEMI